MTRPSSPVGAAANAIVPAPGGRNESPAVSDQEKQKTSFLTQTFAFLRLLLVAEPTKIDISLLVVGTLAAIASGVPFPILGIIFGQLVDSLNSATCSADTDSAGGAAYQSDVDTKVLQVVYITIASFVTIFVYTVCWRLVGERLVQRLRDQYFRSLLRQEPSFFDHLPAGEVSSRLNGDMRLIQTGTSEKVGICISSASFFVTAYIIAFIKDAKLAGMLVSLVPAFLLMSIVGSKYINKHSGRMSDSIAAASSIASEGLSNVAVVHAFGANARIERKFSADLMRAQKEGVKKAVVAAIQTGLLYFIAYSGNALAFWQGSITIANSVGLTGAETTVGTTYTVIFILVDASLILSQVAPFLQDFGSATAALQRLEKDMNHESALDGTSDTGDQLPETISGEIEFRNVSFTYPSRPDHPVIQDLSLVCPAGKHTAICGLSGSGKSTVAALIGRLYDPLQGSISLDGRDLRELNLRHVRSFISLVQQEPSLLDRSILENIALGLVNSPSPQHSHLKPVLLGSQLSELAVMVRDGQDLAHAANTLGPIVVEIVDLVKTAATLADAIAFINGLEHGLATQVGSIGNLISGGQKQRISLARALVRDPKILILDEATSSLDSESEQRVQASIERILEGRTLVSIAHRLSTIRNADNIIVMRQGRIVEQGSHAELIARNGAYAAMVRLQSLAHGEPADGAEITGGSIKGGSVGDTVLAAKEGLQKEATVLEKKENSITPDAEEVEFVIPLKSSSWTIFKKMAPLVRPYLLILLAAFLTSCLVGGSYSAEAVIFGNTVESLSPCQTEEYIRQRGRLFGLLFFILAIVEFFANVVSWSAFGYFAEQILLKVRVLSFRSLFEQDLQWHQSENRNPAMLLSFITKDGNALGALTGSTMGTLFSIMVNMLVAVILAHIIAWKIALVCLVTVPILLGAGIMQLRVLSQFEERHENAFAQSTGITVEAINSIKTVASLSLEVEILGVYRRSLKAPRKEITRASAYANFWLAIAYSAGNFVYALAYWWGAKQIIAGEYTQTQFFIVLLALLVSAQLWGQMFMLAPDLSKAWAAIARILYLIDVGSTKPGSLVLHSSPGKDGNFEKDNEDEKDIEATADTKSPSPPDSSHGLGGVDVVLRDVKFSYPARPHVEVLRGLNIEIKAGQFCALVGPSGAGKSTILALIERMYTPSAGRISIGGVDIVQTSNASFRESIALVPQDSTLFEGSVGFNVSLGARPGREATAAEIETACRLANVHETVAGLPRGYATNCGPNGRQLSGGQRQRLAIARALLRRPRLLLLDESTSALDAESESLLQRGLDVAARGITVLAIAHRLRTIRRADVIFLIEGGVCVDRGTHEELVARSERYRVNTMHQT